MALSDLIADCLSLAYGTDLGGVAAVHSTADSDETQTDTSCPVVIDTSEAEEYRGADEYGATAEVRVRVSEVATVSVGQYFTVGSDVWEIMHARKSTDETEWTCECAQR